jgi:hypothetical protein
MEKVQHFHLVYHPINKKLVVIFNIGNIKYNMIIKLVFNSKNNKNPNIQNEIN